MTAPQNRSVCAYPWQQMIIDLTGEVVPCCFWSGYANQGKPLGNTNSESLEAIWNGEAYRDLRRRHAADDLEGTPCHRCMAWTWGGGTYPKFSWPAAFVRESGHCWIAVLPQALTGDPAAALFEDGEPLPLPEAVHDDIRALGMGRYSVWKAHLYFSTSDNSDPLSNGRRYELRSGVQRWELPGLRRDAPSGRNLLDAFREHEAGAEVLTARPSMISYISTADCNIDCPACSQNTVRRVQVQHRARTEPDVLAHVPYLHQFIWHGGEPYLIRRFREFIDGFRTEDNPNLTFGFTSNATLLDAEELAKLDRFPRINASLSIDSFRKQSFERLRAGANYEVVLRNALRAVATYDAPRRVFSVGMIVLKSNFLELADNLRFSIEHDIGLNLSPVVVYPVTEQLNVFQDFARQTRGWMDALAEARDVVARAKAAGRPAVRRIDPEGMLEAIEAIVRQAAARYGDTLDLRVVVRDPHHSLERMRCPGIVVTLDGRSELTLSYATFDRPGEHVLKLPRRELRGSRQLKWAVCHDLLEPMGELGQGIFRDADGWGGMQGRLDLELPPFEGISLPRNASLSNRGIPVPGGTLVRDPVDIYWAYQRNVFQPPARGVRSRYDKFAGMGG